MFRGLVLLLTLVFVATPVLAEQVDIKHPQIKEGSKGLYLDGKAYVPIEVVNQLYPGTFVWDADRRVIAAPDRGVKKPILFVGESDSLLFAALQAMP